MVLSIQQSDKDYQPSFSLSRLASPDNNQPALSTDRCDLHKSILKSQLESELSGQSPLECGIYVPPFRRGHGNFIFPGSKQATNTTRQVVNSTDISGAGNRVRFVTFWSWRISAINKWWHFFLVLAFNILLLW